MHAGANLESRDGQGRTPLVHAVRAGEVGLVRVLLAHGADPNCHDDDGHPGTAAERGDTPGWTPLHHAVMAPTRYAALVHYLLAGGADINGRAADGGRRSLGSVTREGPRREGECEGAPGGGLTGC